MKIFGQHLIDENTIEQMNEAVDNDFTIDWALMPDAHLGYSLPIGGVVLTEGYIVPAWVGYDIGCGMLSAKLDITKIGDKEEIFNKIHELIPTGFNHRTEAIEHYNFGDDLQLGTLGGGNHFIEIGQDDEGYYWITVHSGSRNVGHTIASKYMKSGALNTNSQEARDYMYEATECMTWAKLNRQAIIYEVMQVLNAFPVEYVESVHNFFWMYGNKVLHRKGATQADKGLYGVIPGSMGDGVLIVRGKGNKESLNSCSHGAGRRFSRKKAKATIDPNAFAQSMKGIVCGLEGNLDESPQAYKDINEVMEAQKDCVEVVTRIKPIINVKG